MSPNPTQAPLSSATDQDPRQTRIFRAISLTIAVILLFLIIWMFFLFSTTSQEYRDLEAAHDRYLHAEGMMHELHESSSALTRFSRAYVVTGDTHFRQLFDNVLAVRDGAVPLPDNHHLLYWDFMASPLSQSPFTLGPPTAFKDLIDMKTLTDQEKALLEKAHDQSDALAKFEIEMMSQVPADPSMPDYVSRLYDADYHEKKLSIMRDLNTAFTSIEDRMEIALDSAHAQISKTARVHLIVFCLSLGVAAILLTMLYMSRQRIIGQLQIRIKVGAENLNKSLSELQAAQEEIKTLKGLMPICMYCHQIRNERGAWERLEVYLSENSGVTLSHRVCPNCNDILLDELNKIEQHS